MKKSKIPTRDTSSRLLHKHSHNQVFINFRGKELRCSFVSHLVEAFKRHGIIFFIDKDEQKGKDRRHLFARINQSRMALTIFSKRYAESRWCLNELARIKKRADKRKLQVVPIFFKVKAESVRYQKAEFGRNFWRLAKTSSGEQIKKWKEALESVSDKMGLSLGDNSSEADFIEEIVKEVKRVLAVEKMEDHSFSLPHRNRKDLPKRIKFS
ncbi:Toll/interleukin-1 receptor homology (TIR) domain [Arabidopsis suecica]|uniref:Toll/interleukin-1 receptor homology (TIR) domain n=1 Tax=Arabidopsis suecica TaxID=45249 RepID=A0A8T2H0T8_ARASU|nr:Toll/interleukin-1 receptor homology (TIR) domain [Arabidopsis suecica]